MTVGILETFLLVLLLAILVNTLFHRLHLSKIIGYIVVGILVGPASLAVVPDKTLTMQWAEFGVAFLMFTIGLSFSLSRLWQIRSIVFVDGSIQVLLSVLVTCGIGVSLGMAWVEAMVVGCIVAMSSTAIVSKAIEENMELQTPHGLQAIGILLFQDLAVIPLFILFSNLSTDSPSHWGEILLSSVIKGGLSILLIMALGHWVFRRLFHIMANLYSMEMFNMAVLLVAIGSAWITHELGLSLALGAFVAGIMLSESAFRHQIQGMIKPFRDLLLGFFFITIGTALDLAVLQQAWYWVLLLLSALVLFKWLMISAISYRRHRDVAIATQAGLLLAQGGEFGFALLSMALDYRLVPNDYGQVILAALLISMMLTPLIIAWKGTVAQFLAPTAASGSKTPTVFGPICDHIIVSGFQAEGQILVSFLSRAKLPYLAFERDMQMVREATDNAHRVYYGDLCHPNVLVNALPQAKAVVLTETDWQRNAVIIEQIRRRSRVIPIICQCQHQVDVSRLYEVGATEVIPQALESGLMLSMHVLLMRHFPIDTVMSWIEDSRQHHYDMLRMLVQDALPKQEDSATAKRLHAVQLFSGASAVGKSLADFHWSSTLVTVAAIRRGTDRITDVPRDFCLQEKDVVVLYGVSSAIDGLERQLLQGAE